MDKKATTLDEQLSILVNRGVIINKRAPAIAVGALIVTYQSGNYALLNGSIRSSMIAVVSSCLSVGILAM